MVSRHIFISNFLSKTLSFVIPSLILLIILLPHKLYAFIEQELSEQEILELMEEWKPLEVEGDAIAWSVFAQTKEIEDCSIDADGFDYCIIKPQYHPQVTELDGQQLTLMGFMFPLQAAEKQQNFLIGPYPLNCPFHYLV